MPRGRPRKNLAGSPSESCHIPTASSSETITQGVRTSSRNRIAVRKFDAASEDVNYQECPPGSSGQEQPGKSADGYVFIHKNYWSDLCAKLACSSCGKPKVQMKVEKLSGLASKLIMYCTACGIVLSQVTTSPDASDDPNPEDELDFDVNRRFVKFFVNEGKTYDDVVVFSKTLGIPIISKAMFEKYRDEFQAEK